MNRRNLARLLLLAFPMVCLTILVPVRHAQQIDESDAFSSKVQPFLSANCYTCHNSSTRSGGLDLEAYKTTASVLKDRDRWQKVLRRLRAGEMPPEGMPRPDKAQADFVIRWIASQVGAASQPVGSTRSVSPDPGHITARRLNRAEYDNTIRDLLGVNLHPADDFPQDDSGYGFDNIGDVLSLSPILMEKYLAAAEKVARAAVFGPEQLKPTLARQRASAQGILPRLEPLFDYDLSGLTLPNALHLTHRFPVDGEYHFRVFLGGNRPAGSEALDLSLWVDGKQTRVVHFDPGAVATFSQDRQELYGMAQDFRVRLDAGDHWIAASILHLYDGLPPTFKGPNPSKLPIPAPPEFKPPPDLPPERVAEIRKTIAARRAEKIPANDARIASVEIGGPYDQPKGPSLESLKKIYTCGHLDGHHKPGCERKIIADVAHRAFRRPVTPQEVSRLLGLFSMARQHGDSFEEGIVVALEAMLVSPQFLFRLETGVPAATVPTKAPAGVPVTDHELASRLSYFLWSSMPDDDLLRAADQGVLHKPEVLNSQVRRMLKDGRAHALVDNFGGQWLELRKLESVRPDRKRFPEFDEYLAMSMRRETELFFENIIHQDLSILDFVDGNYSFLNERLARFYKIPGVSGPEFRRVDLSGT